MRIVAFFGASLLAFSSVIAAAPKSGAQSVALHLVDGRTAIDVMIDGKHPLRANFDSGAQGMVVAKSLVESLKLPVVGKALLGSPAGGAPIEADVVQLQSLAINGVNVPTAPRSLDGVAMDDARFPPGVQIILAASNFPQTQVTLDFSASKFVLAPSNAEEGEGWLALDERGLTATTLKVGDVSVPLHVDTGNPGVLDFPASLADELPLLTALKPDGKIKLVDKTVATSSAELKLDASIGSIALKLSGTFRFAPLPFANMGAGALNNARLTIDADRKRWRLAFNQTPAKIEGRLAKPKVAKR